MGTKISGYVDDELAGLLEDIADHHDIPKTRALELLLREGVQAREHRLRLVQLEAKLDLLLESFAEEENAKTAVEDQVSEAMQTAVPQGTTGVDLVEEPHPAFQSLGIRPDDWQGPTSQPSDD